MAETNERHVKTWAQETGITDRPPKVLLTSVFGPYATGGADVQHNFSMELFNNQVTRAQGAFSPRLFHRSYGIKMIQENLSAPSMLLDFPTKPILIRELKKNRFDIIGISSIIMNLQKVKEMCSIIRSISPKTKIVVGGYVSGYPDIEKMVDADHFVKGDGIRWMRRYVGDDENAAVNHPAIISSFGGRYYGVPIPEAIYPTAATIVPSVGCPMGCSFCATSAFFGGRGKSVSFFSSGKELFDAMCKAESELGSKDFFIQDENFLLHRRLVMELLRHMEEGNKSWSMMVFASANAISQYTTDELVRLGVCWIWLGIESPRSKFTKLEGSDTLALVKKLHEDGIMVCGSSIIGLDHHTTAIVEEEIERAISHGTDYHQFMLCIPFPGTQLYQEFEASGRLLGGIDHTGFPGLDRFSFKHPSISREESKRLIDLAFSRDFQRNGPSIFRGAKTIFTGYKKHKGHPEKRVRERFRRDARTLKTVANAALWAMERSYIGKDESMAGRIRALRLELEREFGITAVLWGRIFGSMLYLSTLREEKSLASGRTYEPRTFIERKNW